MKKMTLKRRDRTREWRKMTINSPKNVPNHDGCFIKHCQVRLCEDSQVYITSSTLSALQHRRIYSIFKPTLTHAGLARKRKIVLLRFGFISEERKCFLDHLVEKREEYFGSKVPPLRNHYNLMKTRSQFGASSLETFVVSIESLYICPSSTLRIKTTRRKI